MLPRNNGKKTSKQNGEKTGLENSVNGKENGNNAKQNANNSTYSVHVTPPISAKLLHDQLTVLR